MYGTWADRISLQLTYIPYDSICSRFCKVLFPDQCLFSFRAFAMRAGASFHACVIGLAGQPNCSSRENSLHPLGLASFRPLTKQHKPHTHHPYPSPFSFSIMSPSPSSCIIDPDPHHRSAPKPIDSFQRPSALSLTCIHTSFSPTERA